MLNNRPSDEIMFVLSAEDYVRQVTQPRTFYELELALRDRNSSPFKDMMNMLKRELDIFLIIEKLNNKYLVEQYQATEEEKEAVRQAMIREEAAWQEWKNTVYRDRGYPEKLFEEISKYDDKKLSAFSEKCEANIARLQQQIGEFEQTIKELESKEKQNTQELDGKVNEQIDQFKDALRDKGDASIRVYDADSDEYNPIDLDGGQSQQILKHAFTPKPRPEGGKRELEKLDEAETEEPKYIERLPAHAAILRVLQFAQAVSGSKEGEEGVFEESFNYFKAKRNNEFQFEELGKPKDINVIKNIQDLANVIDQTQKEKANVMWQKALCEKQMGSEKKMLERCKNQQEKITPSKSLNQDKKQLDSK